VYDDKEENSTRISNLLGGIVTLTSEFVAGSIDFFGVLTTTSWSVNGFREARELQNQKETALVEEDRSSWFSLMFFFALARGHFVDYN